MKQSIRFFIEKNFKVESKLLIQGSKIIPFKCNEAQDDLFKSIEAGDKEHIIPKARQLGISTGIDDWILAECLTVGNIHAAIISHEAFATKRLLRRVDFVLEQMAKDGKIDLKKDVEYNSVYEKTFPNKNSNIYIGTAGQRSFSRGDTINRVHASEIAWWLDPEGTMTGVTGALTNDALIFLESTGNGAGGYFYNRVQWAKKGDSSSKLHFYPWTLDKTYVRPIPEKYELSEDEKFLISKYGLSLNQIFWRRWKIENYDGNIDLFQQEFPITLEECFLATGTTYFDKYSLRAYIRLVRPPIAVGIVEEVGGRSTLQRTDNGWLNIWEYPKPGIEYLIAADCSEGLEDPNADDACAQVINRETYSQSAVLAGKLDPHEMAISLYSLGHYYNWPWIAVEENGPGLAVILKLKELSYPRIYRRRTIDPDNPMTPDHTGWRTDARTRSLILSALRSSMKRSALLIRDERLLQQCSTFCRQNNLKYQANSGCHDDHVMAMAIAAYLHQELPHCVPVEEDFGSLGRIFESGEGHQIIRNKVTGY